jgi:hypothetical protein
MVEATVKALSWAVLHKKNYPTEISPSNKNFDCPEVGAFVELENKWLQ